MKPYPLVVGGTVKPDGTVEVNARLNWPPGAVRITIEPIEQADKIGPGIVEVMEQIRKEQEARGYQPPTPEEMEAWIRELRDDEEYEKRWQEIWAMSDRLRPPSPEKP